MALPASDFSDGGAEQQTQTELSDSNKATLEEKEQVQWGQKLPCNLGFCFLESVAGKVSELSHVDLCL